MGNFLEQEAGWNVFERGETCKHCHKDTPVFKGEKFCAFCGKPLAQDRDIKKLALKELCDAFEVGLKVFNEIEK